jgi:hypothetical protein
MGQKSQNSTSRGFRKFPSFLSFFNFFFFNFFLVGGASRKGFNRFMPYSSPPRLLKPKLKIKNKKLISTSKIYNIIILQPLYGSIEHVVHFTDKALKRNHYYIWRGEKDVD